MIYEEAKETLYECLGLDLHDTVVYLKGAGFGQDINGSSVAPMKAQAQIDHKIDFPELYGVDDGTSEI